MARKTRRKNSASRKKKKSATERKKRRAATKRRSAGRGKAARRVKHKGVIAAIAGAARAVVSTLTDAERLHHKMEPHVSPDPE